MTFICEARVVLVAAVRSDEDNEDRVIAVLFSSDELLLLLELTTFTSDKDEEVVSILFSWARMSAAVVVEELLLLIVVVVTVVVNEVFIWAWTSLCLKLAHSVGVVWIRVFLELPTDTELAEDFLIICWHLFLFVAWRWHWVWWLPTRVESLVRSGLIKEIKLSWLKR